MMNNSRLNSTIANADDCLAGGGEMGAFMRAFDWAASSLGPVATWPQSLRTSVSICLNSRFPIVLWWGPELRLLYNDAWRPALGTLKHPAVAKPGREVWAEIWHLIGPMLEGVLRTGEATWSDDMLLPMDRYGYLEETYWTYSYSPIRVEAGEVGGVFTAVTETTSRVLGERRLRTLRDLGGQAAQAKTVEEACELAMRSLAENPADVPFALLYLLDAAGAEAALCGTVALERGGRASPEQLSLLKDADENDWPLALVCRTGKTELVTDLVSRFRVLPSGPWTHPPEQALVLPLRTATQEKMAGLLVIGVSPARALDEEYRSFFELTAGHIATAIANARAYQEERQRAEALAELDRAKTTFFSNVSHEFRTPLTLMLGPVEDMLAKPPEGVSPDQQVLLTLVHRNGLRLLKLVNTLLDFSRIEAGRVQAVYEATDLAALTADLASTFRSAVERAGMRLLVDCPPLPEPVYVDRDMWEKVVLNLLSNAFKFTLEGEIEVSLHSVGQTVKLMVRDTGAGIPEAELPHLFERFHRVEGARARTQEGTGIGLALVLELVKLHGGSIEAQSREGKGTTFTVELPFGTAHLPVDRVGSTRTLASTALGATPYVEEALRWLPDSLKTRPAEWTLPTLDPSHASDARRKEGGGPARIVLADDNADMRDYVRRLLAEDYEVEAVPDGEAALAAIRREPPDLVLSDAMMPHRDGFELLRALRADPRTEMLPIILLSARAGEEARVQGLEAGADDYLVKPFSARELLARVSSLLELARIRQEAAAREQQMARKLAESEAHLRRALSAARMVAWSWDPERDVVEHTDNLAAVFGLSPGTSIASAKEWFNCIHPEDRARHQAAVQSVLRPGGHYRSQFRVVNPETGDTNWLEEQGTTVCDEAGQVVRVVGVVANITDRKQIEENLRQEALTIQTINQIGQSLLSDLEQDRLVQSLTDLATELVGAQFGAFFYNVVNDKGEAYALYTLSGAPREAFANFPMPRNTDVFGPTFRGEGVIRSDDITKDPRYGLNTPYYGMPEGHLPVRSYLAAPVISRNGEVLGGLFFGHEAVGVFTERHEHLLRGVAAQAAVALDNARLYREAQQARVEAETASRLKDEFLATVSHELRTPLNAILGYAQLLRQPNRPPEQIAKGLETIERNVKVQTQLINDLLDVSRIISGKLRLDVQPVDLAAVIHAAIDAVLPAAEAKNIRIQRILDPLAARVSGDPNRLQQVVWNLLSNAIKYTPSGGRVQVLLERVNSHLEITVSDTGQGIAPDFLPHAFERFRQVDSSTTRRHGGLGLGLAIVRHLVELHGGTVRAKSPGEGQGSTFIVLLPLPIVQEHTDTSGRVHPLAQPPHRPEAVDAPLECPPSLKELRVLVVDDEPDARELMKQILEECEATVEVVPSTRAALEAMETFRPEVLISDIGMPDEDGYELIRRVRALPLEQGGGVAAAALTAYARPEDRRRALLAGFQAHLPKPIERDDLLTIVASLAGRTRR